MKKIKIYKLFSDKLKEFKDMNNNKYKKDKSNCDISLNYSEEYGFQLTYSDLGEYFNNFLNAEQKRNYLNSINLNGYLSIETANLLKELLEDNNYDLYVKSIYSGHVNSFFKEGVRCLNNTSSLLQINPKSIDEVKLDASISLIHKDDFSILIHNVKNNYGYSQGYNVIDGTLILKLPKGFSKEDILYYNDNTNTFNIDPKYIVGFIQVDKDHNVKDFIFSNYYINKDNKIK